MKFRLMLPAAVLAAFSPTGHAQESDAASAGATLAPIRVNAQKATPLTQPLDTGSRLGLTSLETPASVEQIDRKTLDTRGDSAIVDAVSRAAGISASPHPGNGGSEPARAASSARRRSRSSMTACARTARSASRFRSTRGRSTISTCCAARRR